MALRLTKGLKEAGRSMRQGEYISRLVIRKVSAQSLIVITARSRNWVCRRHDKSEIWPDKIWQSWQQFLLR